MLLTGKQPAEQLYSKIDERVRSMTEVPGLFALYEKYIAFRQAYADVRETLTKLFEEYTDIALDLTVTPAGFE